MSRQLIGIYIKTYEQLINFARLAQPHNTFVIANDIEQGDNDNKVVIESTTSFKLDLNGLSITLSTRGIDKPSYISKKLTYTIKSIKYDGEITTVSITIGKSCNYTKHFDKEKAYHYNREGVIAVGSVHLKYNPENIVECYSYVKPGPENECGMRDKGTDLYFVGLQEGEVEVTFIYEYPICESEQYTVTLKVTDDLTVTKID